MRIDIGRNGVVGTFDDQIVTGVSTSHSGMRSTARLHHSDLQCEEHLPKYIVRERERGSEKGKAYRESIQHDVNEYLIQNLSKGTELHHLDRTNAIKAPLFCRGVKVNPRGRLGT